MSANRSRVSNDMMTILATVAPLEGRALSGIGNPYWDYLIKNVPKDDMLAPWGRQGGTYCPTIMPARGNEPARWGRDELTRAFAWAIPSPDALAWLAGGLAARGITKIVEVCAGTGYWAMLLEEAGFDVVAYDQDPPHLRVNTFHSDREKAWLPYTQEEVDEITARWRGLRETVEYLDGLTPASGKADGPRLPPLPDAPKVGEYRWVTRAAGNSRRDVFFDVRIGGAESVAQHGDRALFLCWPPYDDPAAFDILSAYLGDTLVFIGEGEGGCTGDDEFFELLQDEWLLEAACPVHTSWSGLRDDMTIYTRKAKAIA